MKFKDFLQTKGISEAEFANKSAEDIASLYSEHNDAEQKRLADAIENKASKEDIDALKTSFAESLAEANKATNDVLKAQGLAISKMLKEPKAPVDKALKDYLIENSSVLKTIKERAKKGERSEGFSFTVNKGTQGASDIGGRDYLGTIDTTIGRKPVRRTAILDLFRRKPVTTEYFHFWEENVVTRDAKFVVACATSTHNTKKTWQKRTVELAKIRDIIDICVDMLEDYSFVESELKQLVEESIALKADYEMLLGTGVLATDMLSINTIASEFNHANPLAVYTDKFQSPTLGDLTSAMKAQIYTFGQENAWMADTVVMNYNDMITYLHAKDKNDNYLFPTFVFGQTDVINGMRIVTSPVVSANTLYVFDSTKGSILDRKSVTLTASYENKDNIEHELVTFVGVERLQFHVRNIDRDAFMKCSNITTALADIAKP